MPVFSPLLVNFIWGNHDWLPLIHGNPLLSGLIEGRFSQYILLNLLLGGKILPVLNILLGFIFYTAALFLLYRRFFAFSVRPAIAALFLSAAAGLPFAAELLYFHFITFSLLSWPLIIALSLLCCQKASGSHPIISRSAAHSCYYSRWEDILLQSTCLLSPQPVLPYLA